MLGIRLPGYKYQCMSFFNKNICRSYSLVLSASTTQILSNQECSEIIAVGATTTIVIDQFGGEFTVPTNTYMTFRGITNSNQLSARGTGTMSYRTQLYDSITPISS